MPKLSIIMPIYNTENYLDRSIQSILYQTYQDWELILINDGSTDNSAEKCMSYSKRDSRIKFVDKENGGAGSARNMGLEIASGKYLAFLDSDDRIENNTYFECITIMEKEQCDLLIFGMRTEVYDDDSNTIIRVIEDKTPELLIKTAKEFHDKYPFFHANMKMGSPCNKIYKRDIIEINKIKFPSIRRMQDCVFNLYYFDYVERVCTINKNYFIRTWHSNEFQRKKMPLDFIDCAITYYKILIETITKWNIASNYNIAYFGESFSEIIITAEFDYLPSKKPSFYELYSHVKRINNNSFIHSFYHNIKKYKKLRKLEYAMMNKWNIVIALRLFLSTRL